MNILKQYRILGFDFLKSICAIFVIVTHFIAAMAPEMSHRLLFPFYIDMAVPIFLIITGYVSCLSMEKLHVVSIIDCYEKKYIKSKLKRAIMPYIITLLLELILVYFTNNNGNKDFVSDTLKRIFLDGALGPGGYYPVIYIQIIIWFPFMYYCFQKNRLVTFSVSILLNIGFEIFAHSFLKLSIYRLLSLRYLTIVLLGMCLYFYKDYLGKTYIPQLSFISGIIYLIYVNYIKEPMFFTWWTNTTLCTSFYALAIVWYISRCEDFFNRIQYAIAPFLKIGKASYQILFTQMIFFGPLQSLKTNLTWVHQYVKLRLCILAVLGGAC